MDNPETQINRQHRDAEKWTTQRRREMDNPETQRNGQHTDEGNIGHNIQNE